MSLTDFISLSQLSAHKFKALHITALNSFMKVGREKRDNKGQNRIYLLFFRP